MSVNKKQFSLMGHNFSWFKQVGHEFEQQRAGSLRNAVRRICVKIECGLILQADQRPKQNHKDEILPAHPQELFLWVKELGPMLNQEKIQSPIMLKCRIN